MDLRVTGRSPMESIILYIRISLLFTGWFSTDFTADFPRPVLLKSSCSKHTIRSLLFCPFLFTAFRTSFTRTMLTYKEPSCFYWSSIRPTSTLTKHAWIFYCHFLSPWGSFLPVFFTLEMRKDPRGFPLDFSMEEICSIFVAFCLLIRGFFWYRKKDLG